MRKIKRILVTETTKKEIPALSSFRNVTVVEMAKIDALLTRDCVHQGILVEAEPLPQPTLSDWLAEGINKPVLVLDQVTDPHNVGAILRSSAAFGVGAVIATDRNAPTESGVMAKAASGALETVPLITVGNLVQAIEVLKKAGYWSCGLDGEAKQAIAELNLDLKTALVLGAEGKGLRRLTGEHCDFLVRLPMSDRMESLNVSNAAAVALYDLYRRR